MSDYDDYLDSVLGSPTAHRVLTQEASDLRGIVMRGRLAAGLAARIRSSEDKPRVSVRCPVERCERRPLAEVWETDQGPLYVATISGGTGDARDGQPRPWESLRRLLALPDDVVDDDRRLVEIAHHPVQPERPFRNVPVLPWDFTPDVSDTTVMVLLDPALTPLWCRCPGHRSVTGTLDPAEVLAAYEETRHAEKHKQQIIGNVRPLG